MEGQQRDPVMADILELMAGFMVTGSDPDYFFPYPKFFRRH